MSYNTQREHDEASELNVRHTVIIVLLYSFVLVCVATSSSAQASYLDATPPKNTDIQYPSGLPTPLPEGTVTVLAHVNDQGKVVSPAVMRKLSPVLDNAVSEAVSGWQFSPAKRDGKPVGSFFLVDVMFGGPHPFVVVTPLYTAGTAGVTLPKVNYAPDPMYTKAARDAKIVGTVVLWLVVNKQGLPERIKVQRSLDPGLDQAAVDAVERWKFEPACKDGQPVAFMLIVEVNFKDY